VVKKRGSGVGVNVGSEVKVGSRVNVAGIGVGEAGTVAVGGRTASGVGVACWQAVVRMRHPMRMIFFMLIPIEKRTTLRQYVSGDAGN